MGHDLEQPETQIGDNFTDFLSRIDKIPLEQIVETASERNCKQEFAGVIYLLSNELGLDAKLIQKDLEHELDRLKKVDSLPPEVESYFYEFAVKEGKWIAFLRGALYNSLHDHIESIKVKFSKLNIVKGSDLITLATQILMERQFIAANNIIPIIERWIEEHPKATDLDAVTQIYASLIHKENNKEILKTFNGAKSELIKQIEIIGNILSEAEQTNWIIRALIEAEMLYEDYSQPLEEITSKGLADMIIWLLAIQYNSNSDTLTIKQDIGKMMTRFQLESNLGLKNATTQAKLEYNLLMLNYKDKLAKPKLAEKIIFEAWKESRLSSPIIDVGREILALLLDYSSLTSSFVSKVPRHFEFVSTYYKSDKIRLARALDRIKIKGSKPTDQEMQEAVIVDYLIQFLMNYFVEKLKADPNDLEVPDEKSEMDISIAEKDVLDMIDAALRRGLRTKDPRRAIEIFNAQINSLYQRLLNVVENEVTVGETIIYGLFNSHGRKISRESARDLILTHFKRMRVSLDTSGKKRIDSVVQKAISIEIEDKIIKRNLK